MPDAADSNTPISPDPYAALRYKDFRSYISMRFFFTFAYQMQTIVLGAYIYDITHDKIALALIGLFEAIPAIGLALFGGYVSDKFEKRKLLLLVFGLVVVSSAVMLVITYQGVAQYLHIKHIVPVIYAMIFINGVARAFYAPAAFTVLANSVPKELYPNSSTWNGSAWKIASIIAPVAGGFIYGLYGITPAFATILVFLLIALMAVSLLKKIQPTFVPKEGVFKSLTQGIRFVFSNRMMLGALSLDMFSVFFGGVVMLLPVFAKDILHVGPEGLGMLRGASSLGAVITMLAMTRFSPMGKPWRNLLIVVTGFGLSIICFALSRNFYLSLFFLFAEGAFDSVSMTIRGTIMQLLTPDDMRGRVSSVNQMFISSSNEIGDFESGMAAHFLGTVPAAIFGGVMTLVVVTITYAKTRKLLPLSLHEINARPEVTSG